MLIAMPRLSRRIAAGVLGVFAAAASALAQPGTTYIALGDSYGFGITTEASYTQSSNGDRGYVSRYADALAAQHGGVRPGVLNLAITGETTGSYFDLSETARVFNTNYAGQTQMQRFSEAVAAETTAGRTISTVSLSFVGADLLELAQDPAFPSLPPSEQATRVFQTLLTAQTNYINILNQVRGSLPTADLILLGYPNAFRGLADQTLADLVDPAVNLANGLIAELANAYGGRYIDVYSAFSGNEAIYTQIVLDQSILPNPHPTEAGYDVIAAAMVIPAPAGGVVLVIAVAGLTTRRRR